MVETVISFLLIATAITILVSFLLLCNHEQRELWEKVFYSSLVLMVVWLVLGFADLVALCVKGF